MSNNDDKFLPKDLKVEINSNEIRNIVNDYDRNNANQIRTSGGIEYTLYEMLAKKMMNKIYSSDYKDAIKDGYVYPHDKGQELIKGINCFTVDPRFVLRKGVTSYGDNHLGVSTKPAKHFGTAVEHLAQTLGLSSTYIAGGVAIASFNVFLAPYIVDLDYEEIYQVIQGFMFQMNEAYKNRGCVSGDTKIWCKLDGDIDLLSFNELCDLLEADYGETKIPFKLEVLTVDDDRNVIWHEATSFWRNEPRDLYEVKLNKHKSFICDKNHSVIRYNYLTDCNIFDIKKGTQICNPVGLYNNINIVKNNDYYEGLLSGFYVGDGYKTHKGDLKYICVGKPDKKEFIEFMLNKLDINYTTYERHDKRYDTGNQYLTEYRFYHDIKNVDCYLDNPSFLAGWLAGFTSSDGSIRIGTSGNAEIQYTNTNERIIQILKYVLFYFNILFNWNIKKRNKSQLNWNKAYRINISSKHDVYDLFNQLDLRSTQKELIVEDNFSKSSYGNLSRIVCKSVTPLNRKEETFCLTVNGRMIISEDFILTNNSQSLFSSIGIDLKVPEFLKNERAVVPGGFYDGSVYGDYEEEAKLIAHIITKVSLEGDGYSKPLFFPNLIYNIDGVDLDEWDDIFELSAKYALPYFSIPSNNCVEYASTLGCRSCMPSNWTGDPNIDCMGTGNSVYTTLNLPAIALKCKYINNDINTFYDELDYYMEIVRKYNLERLERIKWLWYEKRLADFMIQELDGTPLYRLDDATIVCGYLGLSEALEILYDTPIHENNEKAREIMHHMRDNVDEWKKEDKLRWGLFQTPAENCSHTLAKKMVNNYGFKKSKAKGTSSAPFYTNSNHVPVNADISLGERIKIEGNNQPIGSAGNIMNIYTSEAFSDPSAIKSLVEKVRDKTSAYFFAVTGEYSICSQCNTTYRGIKDECIVCNAPCDVFSRITGYVTNVRTWNDGKKSEFESRRRY